MEDGKRPTTGFLGSLRRLADTCLSGIHNRVALFALEFQEEKNWLIATVLWCAVAIFFGGVAVVLGTLTILIFCPKAAQPWVLLALSVVFAAVAIGCVLRLRRQFKTRVPFSGTLGEVEKDLHWLRSGK